MTGKTVEIPLQGQVIAQFDESNTKKLLKKTLTVIYSFCVTGQKEHSSQHHSLTNHCWHAGTRKVTFKGNGPLL